jgi:hypothetical protein
MMKDELDTPARQASNPNVDSGEWQAASKKIFALHEEVRL